MAFERATTQSPTAIGSLEVTLYRADPTDANDASAVNYRLIVKYDEGGSKERSGNLVNHLTANEISALQNFMEVLYARAEEAILPIAE
jgi:hypothetical protein